MPHRLAITYAKLHHGVPSPPEPLPLTSESSGYLDALEDDDIDTSMILEEEEEDPPPPCGPLQAALLGSFEMVHRETSMRALHAITLKQTNASIASHAAQISVEFAAKEAAAKKLMAAE
jgi:hypothetical protein